MERSEELSMNHSFLQSLKDIVLSNLENEQFGTEDLAREMGLSRSQIHRKLQKINGKSITQFIMEIRLDIALDLLKREVGTASEIAYKVGFSSPAYFTKCFHEHFGYTPSEAKYSINTSGNAPDKDDSSDGTTIVPIDGSEKEAPRGNYRKLTTIMFSDICGYTAIMEEREKEAILLLKRNRELHQSIMALHDGVLIKENGDVIVASFETPTDAVRCAQQIINAAKEEENLKLHIGIHLGEIHFIDDDIFGDGVHVASRLEQLAKPNQILVSDPIHTIIKNKHGISSTFIAEKHLNNVDEPVRMYSVEVEDYSGNHNQKEKASTAELTKSILSRRVLISVASLVVIALVMIVFYLKPWSKAESTIDNDLTNTTNPEMAYSIAVMAFKDMSPDHDMEYLSDGISEVIINMLTRVKGLKVIGRTSSFSFKGKETDIKTIGEILGVKMVLEGSVMKSGNQLRITTQLINAEDGFQIWSELYDKPFTEIFALQDQITQSVVSRISENLVSDKLASHDDKGTDNPEAYENFLKGEFVAKRYYVKWELEDFELAETYYKNAIVLDSNFALPHLSLTDLYGSRLLGLEFDEDDQLRQKLSDLWIYNLNKGYALDPDNEISNAAKAGWFWANDKNIDIDSAHYYYKKALVINPKNAAILLDFASFLRLGLGFFEQALLLCIEAIEIDPLNLRALTERGYIYVNFLSNFDKAEPDLEEVLKLSPENNNNILAMFVLNAQKGNQQETMKYLSKMHEENIEGSTGRNFPFFCDSVTNALFAKEDKEKLVPNLESNYWIIMPPTIFMSLDMYEEQLDFLEKLVGKYPHTSYFPLLSKNPLFEPIRNTPRFQKLLEFSRIRHQELEAKYGNLDFLDL